MTIDHIRYDILAQEALREMVRKVLAEVAKTGLKGDHHFNITIATGAPGVRLPARLREQYPQEMTIVLQYQFWDLKVAADSFEVGLSFGGVPERLTVPLTAITSFLDPSVQFALQFQVLPEDTGAEAPAPAAKPDAAAKPAGKPRRPARHAQPSTVAAPATAASTPPAGPAGTEAATEKPGAEVVRLDRFRKK